MATASPISRELPKWFFEAPVETSFDIRGQGESTPTPEITPISDSGLFAYTSLSEECLRLKAKNAKLKAENDGLRAKVVAMQATSYQPNEKQIDLAAVIGEIVNQIQEELPKLPLVSGAYCTLNAQMNEISINVAMDSLDYNTEKELIEFFIRQEDEFPHISIQTRFPVLSIEEAEDIYPKEGFNLCYKRDK